MKIPNNIDPNGLEEHMNDAFNYAVRWQAERQSLSNYAVFLEEIIWDFIDGDEMKYDAVLERVKKYMETM